jgi:hypothetical protein
MKRISRELTQTLVAHDVPEKKARHMARSVGRGLGLIVIGLVMLAAALGLVGYVVFKLGKEPGMGVMVFSGFLCLSAVYFLVAGGNLMSGQALDAAGESPLFGIAAKAIRAFKQRLPDA